MLGFSSLFMFYFYLRRWFPNNWSVIFPALGYGLVVSSIYLTHSIFTPKIFKSLFKSHKWNLRKEFFYVVSYFILIYIGIILYSFFLRFLHPTWVECLRIFIIVILVGSFPAMIFLMFNLFKNSQKELHSIALMNLQLKRKIEKSLITTNSQIKIKLRNGDYLLNSTDFMFAESEGNYITIHFKNQSSEKIRTTLTQLEKAFKSISHIVKVHRAFIINTEAVSKVEGNNGGYLIHLLNSNKKVPVSRTYASHFKNLIK